MRFLERYIAANMIRKLNNSRNKCAFGSYAYFSKKKLSWFTFIYE